METALKDSILQETKVSKEEAKSALKKDLALVRLLMHDIISTPEVMDAIVEVFYARYEALYNARNIETND